MFASDMNVQRHLTAVERVLRVICDADEYPWFVSDEATAFDVSMLTDCEIKARVCAEFDCAPGDVDLTLPLWELAARLHQPRD